MLHKYDPDNNNYYSSDTRDVCKYQKGSNWDKMYRCNVRIKAFTGKSIIVWKKARISNYDTWSDREVLVQLRIDARTARYQPANGKCRASRATVLGIYKVIEKHADKIEHLEKLPKTQVANSGHDERFEYRVGKVVKPKNKFNRNYTRECASGIHFFLTIKEAAEYWL